MYHAAVNELLNPTEDPEIMALLFNNTQGFDLSPSMHWQEHGSNHCCYYGSCDAYYPAQNNPLSNFGEDSNLTQYGADDGYYHFYDLNETQGIGPIDGSSFMAMNFFMLDKRDSTENVYHETSSFDGLGYFPEPERERKRTRSLDEFGERFLHGEDESSHGNSIKKSNAAKNGNKGGRRPNKKGKKSNLNPNNDSGECNKVYMRQTSMSSSSEDESATSQDMINCGLPASSSTLKAISDTNTKTRARHGSATDPQSLYARKRRERINERLKTLQKLVPNGTKVDISTMLEEAVQYVKFLQLQIKLLSSDDMWMYAPIAYNGKEIGLDINIGYIGGL